MATTFDVCEKINKNRTTGKGKIILPYLLGQLRLKGGIQLARRWSHVNTMSQHVTFSRNRMMAKAQLD